MCGVCVIIVEPREHVKRVCVIIVVDEVANVPNVHVIIKLKVPYPFFFTAILAVAAVEMKELSHLVRSTPEAFLHAMVHGTLILVREHANPKDKPGEDSKCKKQA